MKQLLILSSPTDSSTSKVISWLKILSPSTNILKLCPNDIFQYAISHEIGNNTFAIRQLERKIDSIKVDVVWSRKWHPEEVCENYRINLPQKTLLLIKNHILQEVSVFFDYFFYCFRNVFWLNHPHYNSPNKLIQLEMAAATGFNIPYSILTNKSQKLMSQKSWITKTISNCVSFQHNNTIYTNYTSKLTGKESYDDLFISFVQENIPKEAEIRVFYLLGKCYALLIHSQNNKKTQTDYRKYDYKHPNRLEPCQLPPDIESKIDAFMHAMNLQTGSLDFILTPSGEHVFLEVNPCGQYDIFNTCNIYPDKLIAEALISKLRQ